MEKWSISSSIHPSRKGHHQAWRILYGHTGLTSVSVKAGDKVSTKQTIGTAYTDDDRTEVHLEIWKNTTLLDPAAWISK